MHEGPNPRSSLEIPIEGIEPEKIRRINSKLLRDEAIKFHHLPINVQAEAPITYSRGEPDNEQKPEAVDY